MANLKEIQSVSSTQKTTRAMKLVSTAKLRRAEELAKRSRLFAQKTNQVIAEIASRIQSSKVGGIENRCFVQNDAPQTIDIIFVTADKGLCGGFNMQTIKAVKRLMKEYNDKKVTIRLRGIGKKGIEFFNYNQVEMIDEVKNLSSSPDMERSSEFMARSIKDFKDGIVDAVYLVYNGYKNVITQELHVKRLLPVMADEFEHDGSANKILELEAEDEEKMLDSLVTKYAEFNMYYALIDSVAAEHSARMQAMDAATNNAKEMVKSLKVTFNKARQEAITTELIEIISGVESMK